MIDLRLIPTAVDSDASPEEADAARYIAQHSLYLRPPILRSQWYFELAAVVAEKNLRKIAGTDSDAYNVYLAAVAILKRRHSTAGKSTFH